MDAGTLLFGAGIALGSAALGFITEAAKGWLLRRTTNEDKRKAFQHRTAIELQETVIATNPQFASIYFWNLSHYRRSREWRTADLPPQGEDEAKLGEPRMRVVMTVERLDDKEARESVQALLTLGKELVSAESLEQATRIYMSLESQTMTVNRILGRIIRDSWPE